MLINSETHDILFHYNVMEEADKQFDKLFAEIP